MNKPMIKLSVASLVVAGSTLLMAPAMADSAIYQDSRYGNASGHPPYAPTMPPVPTTTAAQAQYHYRMQNPTRDNPYNKGQYHNEIPYNSGNHYGQYHQNQSVNPPQVINGRPQYNYRNAYPTRSVYPVYNRGVDYRYGYLSRPQWYGRMHAHEYRVLHRDGRDFYYLEPAVYNTGVIVGRPQPGVVLMQYPDRTLEVIEATRLILDVLAR